MGLFSRRRAPSLPTWRAPVPPACSCARHLDDDLLGAVVPFSASLAEDIGRVPDVVVGDLLHPGGLSAEVTRPDDRRLDGIAADFHWSVGVYDDARVHYDDDAALDLDSALAGQSGVEQVERMDREDFLVSAPTLCADGMLAAAALALLDHRVRLPH